MGKQVGLLGPLAVAALLLAACGGSSPSAGDAAPTDGGADHEGADAPATCTSDSDCDDGLFCDGVEICDPGSRLADARGCSTGSAPCEGGSTCDEEMDACLSDCDLHGDSDGDGHDSIECGGDDCDDADPDRFPGNAEVCDAEDHDEDCDATTFGELDADRDGYFDLGCCNSQADGGSVCGDDCADDDPNVHPTAPEVCNTRDDDCNGAIDEGVMSVFHKDADGDGFGDPATSATACSPPDASWVENDTDCDDTEVSANPAATEVCDGIDNDCDTMVDERGVATYYRDADMDGFGDPDTAMSTTECTPPAGFVAVGTDCDDSKMGTHPGADEACDGFDTNCSLPGPMAGGPDSAEDQDGDHHAPLGAACAGGYPRDDCQDSVRAIHPGAAEVCDGVDNDCDGTADNAAVVDAACGVDRSCTAGSCVHTSDLSAGGSFACSLDGGVVRCWGAGGVGQLGDGTTSDRARAMPVTGLSGAVELSLGSQHACARRADGSVWCWGSNASGQLGVDPAGGMAMSAVPVAIGGLTDAVELAAGGDFTCARRAAGLVVCWGANASGQLGGSPAFAGARVGRSLGDVTALAAGLSHACARRSNGRVRCWGANTNGQLGNGTTVGGSAPVAPTGLSGVTQIAAGRQHTCALTGAGVRCWGDGTMGQLGGPISATSPAAAVSGTAGSAELAAGGNTTCVRTSAGAAKCWGEAPASGSGVIGGFSASVQAVPGLGDAVGLALGSTSACARRAGGAVTCWGWDDFGQLGDGGLQIPRLSQFGPASSVAAASDQQGTCAIRADGTLWCSGDAQPRTPGGALQLSPLPAEFMGLASQLSMGDRHSCLVQTDGAVYCWGDNSSGQLGVSGPSFATTPVHAGGSLIAQRVYAGAGVSCAILSGGQVRCWGSNAGGMLGNDTTVDSVSPVAVVDGAGAALTGVTDLAIAGRDVCAVLGGGGLSCWGADTAPHAVPVSVPAGAETHFTRVVRAEPYFCAVGVGRDVWCWSALAMTLSATPEPGLSSVTAADHALDMCFLMGGSSLKCGTPGTWVTVDLNGLTGQTEVARGPGHYCVMNAAGDVHCWGDNSRGQLGLGVLHTVLGIP